MAVSLVSYDSSDDSSEEEGDSNKINVNEMVEQKVTTCTELKLEHTDEQISKASAFQSDENIEKGVDTFLPLPKAKFHNTDIDWNYLKTLKAVSYTHLDVYKRQG